MDAAEWSSEPFFKTGSKIFTRCTLRYVCVINNMLTTDESLRLVSYELQFYLCIM